MLIVDNKSYNVDSFIESFENSVDAYLRNICIILKQWNDDTDLMHIKTSGSTSKPKPISIPKSAMKISALRTQSYFGYKKNDNAILCLPVRYIGGMMMLIRSIVSELNLYVLKPSLNPLHQIKELIHFAPMTPAQLSMSIDNNSLESTTIETILLGGGPVSSTLSNKILSIRPSIYHSFGMTETISHIAIRNLKQENENFYQALQGVHFSVDEFSCLIITADYIGEPIVTKDVVELIDTEKFIWKGRKDNVINSGGLKIYPELIEQKLVNVISEDFFIAAIDDDLLGHKICLVIETDTIIDTSIFLSRISQYLDKIELPKTIYCIEKFDRTETGKVIREKSLSRAISKHKEQKVS